MNENISWTKLLRYVQGISRPEERAVVEEWIASDTDHKDLLLFVEKVLDTPAESRENWDVDSAWLRYNIRHGRDFRGEAGENKSFADLEVGLHPAKHGRRGENKPLAGLEAPRGSKTRRVKKKTNILKWGWVAAAAAMISFMLFFTVPGERESASEVQAPLVKKIESELGQRTHFRLSDGTNVILNAGSTLFAPQTFSDSIRRVRLEGQAFFNVAADSTRPFLVSTDRAVTEVLGTKFDMRAYAEDELVEVTVAEGKVALRSKQDTANVGGKEIMRNQKGSLSPAGVARITEVENMAVHLGWTEGKLQFSNEYFSRVRKTLERYYNINIEIESDNSEQFGERRFTGSFTDNQSLEEVLEAVALSLNMEYRKAASERSYIVYNQ